MQTAAKAPNWSQVHFALVTADNCTGSYTVEQTGDKQTVLGPISWVPAESDACTTHVRIITAATDRGEIDQTISGDDWREIEANGLLQAFTDRMLAGEEPQAVASELIADLVN